MAYTKHIWSNGNTISATRLNNIENGIESIDTVVTENVSKIGSDALTTTAKNLSGGVNELKTKTTELTTTIGTINTKVGSDTLTTTAQSLSGGINELKQATSQLSETKAKESDLQLQKARIDNLATNTGTTVNDLELQDIRVGADGKVYSNSGDSVRSQLNDKVNKKRISTFSPYNTETGKVFYANADNSISYTSSSIYNTAKYNVSSGQKIWLTHQTNERTTSLKSVIFVDSIASMKMVGYDCEVTTATVFTDRLVTVPSSATIMLVIYYNVYSASAKTEYVINYAETEYVDKSSGDVLKNLNTSIYTRTNAIVDMSKLKTGKMIKTWVTSASISDESSYLGSNSVWLYTEIYTVSTGDIIKSAFYNKSQKAFSYMIFDANGKFLSTADQVTEVSISQDGYIIFAFANTLSIPEAVVKVLSVNDFPYVKPYYHKNFVTSPYVEKPLDVIDKTGGYTSIFHDFGVIGDSLANGCMEGYDDNNGTYVYIDNPDFSWGASIARATGCICHRFSRGGQYLHDDNWYSQWESKIRTELCSAYIICIGFNDYNWLYGNSARMGTIADINTTDFTQNPNTFYGQYGKMIQLIKSVQPKAKLFLCNMEWNTTDGTGINDAISAICNYFDNCYLIDLKTYAHEPYWNVPNIFKTGLYHKNTLGYQKMAWDIMSYIDYIVRHNMSDFIDVQFIGTNYRLPTDLEVEAEKSK